MEFAGSSRGGRGGGGPKNLNYRFGSWGRMGRSLTRQSKEHATYVHPIETPALIPGQNKQDSHMYDSFVDFCPASAQRNDRKKEIKKARLFGGSKTIRYRRSLNHKLPLLLCVLIERFFWGPHARIRSTSSVYFCRFLILWHASCARLGRVVMNWTNPSPRGYLWHLQRCRLEEFFADDP